MTELPCENMTTAVVCKPISRRDELDVDMTIGAESSESYHERRDVAAILERFTSPQRVDQPPMEEPWKNR